MKSFEELFQELTDKAQRQDSASETVKAMVKRKGVNDVMDQLSQLGAKGIIVTNIQACRL